MDPMEWLLRNRYGSLELSRQAGPNLLRGLAGSVFLHTFVVTMLFVMTMVNSGDRTKIGRMPEGPIIILPHFPPMPMPPINPILKHPTVPDVVGKPVPVPDDPVEKTDPTITPGPFGVPGPEAKGGTGTNTGPIEFPVGSVVADPDELIPDKTVFIPFEVPPTALDINPKPAYPEMAYLSGVAGKVVVYAFVDKQGNVRKWEVVSVNPTKLGFDEEVEKVILKWRFTPAIQQGKPVGVWVSIPFTFTIKR